ncbi:hypothetical protein [Spirulina sp. 06S082]|uniref:hypothetical protein n=1 Tax=Spirulina sp. 06S082 TaxID=3110248 RepID=UPI002B1EB59F|nr:hypothetical protein [Spirulina sp. 06S082]MEA5471839.1 hypothetical protein [Spirulina sp. 06S082]
MKGKVLNLVGFIIFVSLNWMALPSLGQDLKAELSNAVCHQNWGEAIEVIDRMSTISPQSASRLQDYRDRLVTLQDSEARVPEWQEDCSPPTPLN